MSNAINDIGRTWGPTPPPTAPVGPPVGYVRCPAQCGRWTNDSIGKYRCWTCIGCLPTGGADKAFPDWTPPPGWVAPATNVVVDSKLHTPPADRSRCKAWCGDLAPGGPGGESTDGFAFWVDVDGLYTTAQRGPHYCSAQCRDARVPRPAATPSWVPGMQNEPRPPLGHNPYEPLAATPEAITSSTGLPLCPTCGRLESQHTNPLAHKFGESAKEPKPAAKAAEPVCRLLGIGPHVCDGDVAERVLPRLPRGLYCVQAMMTREASVTQCTQRHGTGAPLDKARREGPDLIDRRMLRDEGVESDCWEAVR